MHLDHDHVGSHVHSHSHEHTHNGVAHTHAHTHEHAHGHTHGHTHEELHAMGIPHDHDHGCDHNCGGCASACQHTPMEELLALMQYMVSHNAAHAKELAELAAKLQETGNRMAYEQVLAAVSDFEKGNMRLSMVLASLDAQ